MKRLLMKQQLRGDQIIPASIRHREGGWMGVCGCRHDVKVCEASSNPD